MTAFDNIKVNNWPAASNEFEDYLVLELPLNDAASLTQSRRDIVVSSNVLFPKRTLTNSGVNSTVSGTVYSTQGTLTGSGWGAGHEISSAFRQGYLLYGVPQASGSGAFAASNTSWRYTFPSPITVTSNTTIHFWRNGGSIKVNAGETDEQTNNTDSGQTAWTIPASDVAVLRNVELYTDYNTGPYWSGIEVNGVQLYDAPGGPKKHYDKNARFTKDDRISLPSQVDFLWGTRDFTFEVWVYPTTDTHGTLYDTGSVNTAGHHALFIDGSYMYWRMLPGTDCLVAHSTSGYTTDEWQHIACVRHNGTLKIYRNGQEVASQANNSNITQGAWAIGDLNGHGPSYRFSGQMQDYRIYNIAKYTSNFTPPGAILG